MVANWASVAKGNGKVLRSSLPAKVTKVDKKVNIIQFSVHLRDIL